MKKPFTLAMVAAFLLAAGAASAQTTGSEVQRNDNQQNRIEQGVKSGALTTHETAKLERGQAKVNRAEARVGADGHVGAGEQKAVQAKENRQSKKIFKQKHDAQTSG